MALKSRSRRGRSQTHRGGSIPRPSPTTDPRHRQLRSSGPLRHSPLKREAGPESGPPRRTLDAILDDFTRSWDRGEHLRAEGYIGLLSFEDSAELIYHEFCLAEAADLEPDPADYLLRFPEQSSSLSRLFALHDVLSSATLQAWAKPAELPSSGDEIGPYRLLRELGRGTFARVFLAEQSDLDHRLVVLKVSTRSTAEPRLLARARHVHIVEVLRHAVAEDGALHLVSMPFLGGATLASVLDERRRQGLRPRSGLDLLSDLDRVSAPEYPATEMLRPAREILAGLSHAQALAWIVARLAEALDHAYQRGVAHGDLKPSNILLTADANPLLLDFNLAVDWQNPGPGDPSTELGGTLAYMAPERLAAIAEGGRNLTLKANDLHRADLYALGLLLFEALTGRIPEVPRRRVGTTRDLAGDLVRLRQTLPAPLGSGGDRSIPPSLRSILSRCLASDPLDRYSRGNELAEDLDRWRSDRPLAFADESRSSNLTRRVRRRRASLIAFGLSMSAAVIVTGFASIVLQGTRRDQALAKCATIIDRSDSGVFGFRKAGLWRGDAVGDPLELTSRQLARYDVLNDPDWRVRDDIRSLPDRERDELEVWLFEQILRYSVALSEAPESPESWKRGLALLDRTLRKVRSEPLQAQRLVLLERLKQPDPGRIDSEVPRLPRWMDAYLAGVAAEPLHARVAMGHYLEALRERPDLFWGHYRTVLAACRINEYEEAAKHLRLCSARSPGNPAMHTQLAMVLYHASMDMPDWFKYDHFGEALLESDRALRIDPDFMPAYRVRAWILKVAGQSRSAEADIDRYAILSRKAGRASAMDLRLLVKFQSGSDYFPMSGAGQNLAREILETDPSDRETRTKLATGLAREGRRLEAISEYDRVIEGEPNRLEARYRRALELFPIDRPAALEEFHRLIDHPRFEELFSDLPMALMAYHHIATDFLDRGKVVEALDFAEQGLVHVKRSRALFDETILARDRISKQRPFAPKSQTLYLLAQIHATASKTQGIAPEVRREHFAKTIEYLKYVLASNPKFRTLYFDRDRRFDEFRNEITRRLSNDDPGSPPRLP